MLFLIIIETLIRNYFLIEGMGIPPLKHVIDDQVLGGNFSTTQVLTLAQGTVNPNSYTTPLQVRNGSIIRQIILQIDFQGGSTSANFMDWYVWFNIAGAQARPNPNSVNISAIKNQVFHQDGCLYALISFTAVSVVAPNINKWRVVIDIPKSFQQINENDAIELVWITSNNNAQDNIKIKAIYKEIFP